MVHVVHKELSYVVNGILFDVHKRVGKFASEKQVSDLVEQLLIEKKMPYQRELILPTLNNEEQIGRHRVDFLIDNKIILEIKYRKYLVKDDYDQVKRYLKVLNLALGILANFREDRIHPKRILNGGGKE